MVAEKQHTQDPVSRTQDAVFLFHTGAVPSILHPSRRAGRGPSAISKHMHEPSETARVQRRSDTPT